MLILFFQTTQKVAKYLGNFVYEFVTQTFQKYLNTSHTGYEMECKTHTHV